MGVPNTETGSLKRQLTDQNPDGTVMGKTSADLEAFYGQTPLPQRQVKEIIGAGTGGASVVTSLFSTTGTAASVWTGTAFTSQYGNWFTSSQSVSGVSTSYSATGYVVSNASVASTAAATANLAVMGQVLGEVCKTLVALGIWNAS